MAEKKYMARMGYTLVGFPEFPIETDDVDVQGKIEATDAFKTKKIWVVDTSKDEALEGALAGVKFSALRKMASAMGFREVHKMKKVELLALLEKEGF